MNILIFQGSPEASQKAVVAAGGRPNEAFFDEALKAHDDTVRTYTLNVVDGEKLPQGMALADFDGVVITGSPRAGYDDVPGVRAQIELARTVFDAGIPTFGSCFGLQLMTQALGGSVRLNPRGREIGIARSIVLNDAGRGHAAFRGKPRAFSALCWHQDEVAALPEGGVALACNAVSEIQAAEIVRGESCFWGVQYHPEFDFGMIAALLDLSVQQNVQDGLARSAADAAATAADFRALHDDTMRTDLAWRYGLQADVLDADMRRAEFGNWLATKVRPHAAGRSRS